MTEAQEVEAVEIAPEAKAALEPIKEVKEISEMAKEISAFLTPGVLEAQAKELNDLYGSLTVAGHVDGKEAGVEAVRNALNKRVVKFRTAIEGEHERLKAPFWNAGKALDKRKREGIALTEGLEARLKKEIADHEAEVARLAREEEERIRKVRDERVQACMNAGVSMNLTDCEQMDEATWKAEYDRLVAAKKESDRLEQERLNNQAVVQKRIADRMTAAAKLGKSISQEDAEFLTEEEFQTSLDSWNAEYARNEEVADFVTRANAEGFALQQAKASEMDEASFMVWMGEQVQERTKAQKADRMAKRAAMLLDHESVAVSVLRDATDEQWDTIYRALLAEREAAPVVSTPAVLIADEPSATAAVDRGLTSGGTNPAAPANVTAEQVAAAAVDVMGSDFNWEKWLADLKVTAKRKCWCDHEEFNPDDFSGGNFDDAYQGGYEDGFAESAREFLAYLESKDSAPVSATPPHLASDLELRVAELRAFGNAWRLKCPDMVEDLRPIVLRFRRLLGEKV